MGYIEFAADDGSSVLVEVDNDEIAPPPGVVKAGLREAAQRAVAQAQATFDEALEKIVLQNSKALMQAMKRLPKQPDSIEATFGLKATGEVGNFAISKAGGEANFTIKLVWKDETTRQSAGSAMLGGH